MSSELNAFWLSGVIWVVLLFWYVKILASGASLVAYDAGVIAMALQNQHCWPQYQNIMIITPFGDLLLPHTVVVNKSTLLFRVLIPLSPQVTGMRMLPSLQGPK